MMRHSLWSAWSMPHPNLMDRFGTTLFALILKLRRPAKPFPGHLARRRIFTHQQFKHKPKGNMYRQGDILIEAIFEIPTSAKPRKSGKRLVLAEGESSG